MADSEAKKRNYIEVAVVSAVALVVIVILALLVIKNPNRAPELPTTSPTTPSSTQTTPAAEMTEAEVREKLLSLARHIADDPTALGPVDAPVTMLVFADYQCPHCVTFTNGTLKEVIKKYVDTGQVRLEWRDLPVMGNNSELAALASRAAANQDKFWEFHDALLATAPEGGRPKISYDITIDIANQIGVADIEKFKTDMYSEAVQNAVAKDINDGREIGISSTPTIIVGGIGITGGQPFEVISQMIEAELAAAKS